MEQKTSRPPKEEFRFLSKEEFSALPRDAKITYIRMAIRAVSTEIDDVITGHADKRKLN
jgi:hypothetical protein